MPYPTKGLQEYMLKSDFDRMALEVGVTGPPGANGPSGPPGSAGVQGAMGPAGAAGAQGASWTPVQSTTAPTLATGGPIATTSLTVSRVNPASDVTGVILAAGLVAGQQVVVLNESGFSITFAAVGTSFVSIGASCVIPAGTHLQFVWNSATNRWYPAAVPGISTPPGSFTVSGAVVLHGLLVSGSLTTTSGGSGSYGDGLYGSGLYGQ